MTCSMLASPMSRFKSKSVNVLKCFDLFTGEKLASLQKSQGKALYFEEGPDSHE